ncbi:MAG TPA: tripartite tricarboxylate transporter TctB family protein [Burkholderiales bacterium]|nr:tripartite tricarboxylate transporter TctB family protein [Burkholderiales bacterium]
MHKSAAVGLSISVMLVSGYAVFAATAWPWKAALFPLVIGIPLFCLAATELLWSLLGAEPPSAPNEVELSTDAAARRRVVRVAAWMAGFFVAIALLGFPIAVPLFVFLYLKLQGGEGWVLSIVLTAAVAAAFYGLFDALLHLPFPAGWLWSWLGLA